MLRFFSKMRYRLAAENRVAKYLRYAVGEILLVVVGIVIALQINNWNTYKKDRQMEKNYLQNFLEEMQADSSFIHGYWAWAYPQKIAGLHMARQYVLYNTVVTDCIIESYKSIKSELKKPKIIMFSFFRNILQNLIIENNSGSTKEESPDSINQKHVSFV